MKGESGRRVVVILLCLSAAVAACIGVSAGTATDVKAGLPPMSVFEAELLPESVLDEIHHLGINLEALLAAGDPIVTDVEPNGGLTTGGEEVVITGSGFIGTTEVTFGGTPATSFTVDSDTQITATVPMHAPGNVQVMVIEGTTESPDTSADDYTYVEPPTTEPPTTAAPTTAAPTTEPPTTAPTESTIMVTTTVAAAEGEDGGLSGGWIAFIAVIAVAAVGGMGVFVYKLGKGGK